MLDDYCCMRTLSHFPKLQSAARLLRSSGLTSVDDASIPFAEADLAMGSKMRSQNVGCHGKWHQRINPGVPWWFCFDSYPFVKLSPCWFQRESSTTVFVFGWLKQMEGGICILGRAALDGSPSFPKRCSALRLE